MIVMPIRQQTPAYASIREHKQARKRFAEMRSPYVSRRQQTPAYASIREHKQARERFGVMIVRPWTQ
jgi:hypothetical protein